MMNYMIYVLLLVLLHGVIYSDGVKRHPDGWKYDECLPVQERCEYWLYIQEKLTMIFKKDLVYADNGKLYLYNEHPSNYSTEVPIDEVVTSDGVNRMFEAVNGTLPGPPIVVYQGQTVVIHIKNLLLSNSATIHFHGLHQKDTTYFDGMPYITQCPIAAGQTFTHRFKVEQKGTYWYHSHIGSQRTNGVFGAFIIKERFPPGVDAPTDMIMTVGDWHHEHADDVYVKMVYGNFIGRDKYQTTDTLDGGHFSGVPWVSALINGRGRYIDRITGQKILAPLTWFNVTHGGRYRFRVIGSGSIYPLRISVDNHPLKMVATDGYDFQPLTVESFIINPGERFDFLLEANQSHGNYWVRAVSMEDNVVDHTVEAILHYVSTTEDEPVTRRRKCTSDEPCHVLNCPFDLYPVDQHTICHKVSDLKNADFEDSVPEFQDDSQEHFLNFAFPGEKVTPGSVNGRKFEYPGVNSLFQSHQIGQMKDFECANQDCGEDKICYCHYQLSVPYNRTIQMVWSNMGAGAGWAHPIHLHGHSFYLLKLEYSTFDNVTGKLLEPSPDIDCGGGLNFCNSPRWKNASWESGNVPGLNLDDPIRKDTLIIPTGGYAVIRIRSLNPGKWFLHCHIEVHALDGMGMVLDEAPERPIQRPKGFPVCNHFYDDHTRDIDYTEYSTDNNHGEVDSNRVIPTDIFDGLTGNKTTDEMDVNGVCAHRNSFLIIMSATLAAIVLIQLLIIFTCALSRRSSKTDVDDK